MPPSLANGVPQSPSRRLPPLAPSPAVPTVAVPCLPHRNRPPRRHPRSLSRMLAWASWGPGSDGPPPDALHAAARQPLPGAGRR